MNNLERLLTTPHTRSRKRSTRLEYILGRCYTRLQILLNQCGLVDLNGRSSPVSESSKDVATVFPIDLVTSLATMVSIRIVCKLEAADPKFAVSVLRMLKSCS